MAEVQRLHPEQPEAPPWLVQLASTGDEAEAYSLGGALLAAATLVEDALSQYAVPQSYHRERLTLYLDGRYAGLATMKARAGKRTP